MADLKNWPWALNQPGYDYSAEYIRAEHYSKTSGGNGVSSPTAMKVEAQTAPDGTVRIRPGGSSVASTYPGQEGQSYFSPEFRSKTLTVPPTGSSSGGRTDLIVRRVLDPDHEAHPDHSGEMTEEAAQDLDFQWYELIQGADASTSLSYPHVKLAEIRRPANTTIVNTSHIVDVRVLADPQNERFYRARNMNGSEEQGVHPSTVVWPEAATETVKIPEFATSVVMTAQWTGIRTEDVKTVPASGLAQIALVHPDGRELLTQATRWTSGLQEGDRFNIVLGHPVALPADWRGRTVSLEMRGSRDAGAAGPRMDGRSGYVLDLEFQQVVT